MERKLVYSMRLRAGRCLQILFLYMYDAQAADQRPPRNNHAKPAPSAAAHKGGSQLRLTLSDRPVPHQHHSYKSGVQRGHPKLLDGPKKP